MLSIRHALKPDPAAAARSSGTAGPLPCASSFGGDLRRRLRLLLLSLPPLLATACATLDAPRGTTTNESIERALVEAEQPVTPAAPPPAVTDALLPDIDTLLPRSEEEAEERFDVNVSNATARSFFMGLVDGTRHNMVVHPEVEGRISLTLRNVTVPEVLGTVREVYGYDYRQTPGGFVVMPAALRTRIFQIDYLHMERAGVSRTRVSSGQVSQGTANNAANQQANFGAGGNLGGGNFGGGFANQQPGAQNGVQQVTGSRIDTVHESDFWDELERTVEAVIGGGDGRRVIVNPQAGVVVVRAMPPELRDVAEYLETVRRTSRRQVVLEAKIIEVVLRDGFQAGVNWAAVAENSDGDRFFFGQSLPGRFNGDLEDLGGDEVVVAPGSTIDGFVTETIGSAFALAVDLTDFNAFIELLEVQGDTRVLSSPRVATLNNQKAVIKAGSDEFFVTDISSNTVTGTASTTNRDVQLTPFFSGIALDVTPQVSGDGEVILHIHPTVSEVTDQIKDLTISGETDSLPLAFSEVRESDSIVRARSGQVIVIGGLMRNSTQTEEFRTPVLGRVPGVGNLFKSRRMVERKTELVILLKPVVVSDESSWAGLVADPARRLRAVGGT